MHELDGYHAATIETIEQWARQVYPHHKAAIALLSKTGEADPTLLWWNVSYSLHETITGATDPSSATARLVQMTAELLLSHAQQIHERKYP